MAVLQFPSIQYWFELSSSGTDDSLGFITMPHDAELGNIVLWITKVGTNGGSERFRINVYHDQNYSSLLAQSDWVDVSDFGSLVTGSDWYGYVTFDFNREHLRSSGNYYCQLETENYTNPGTDAFYFGVAQDWPEPINTSPSTNRAGAAMSVLVYR